MPNLNENSFMTALQALIYFAECSAATAGPVGIEMPSVRATETGANVMYLFLSSPFFYRIVRWSSA